MLGANLVQWIPAQIGNFHDNAGTQGDDGEFG